MTFYFAWLDNGNTAWGPEHLVVDERIYGFRVSHKENDFARLEIDIINPDVGLLSAGRRQWAWMSYQHEGDAAVPLFHGRLVGVPSGLAERVIRLDLIARPGDFVAQQAALAASLRVLPFFDPVFITALDDPDAVLEGRSAYWHTGRIDKLVTISDILVGEDGTETIDHVYDDDFEIDPGGEPLRSITVTASVSWDQKASGEIDITQQLLAAFAASGSDGWVVQTYTGEGFERSWVENMLQHTAIGGGWAFGENSLRLLSGNGRSEKWIDTTISPSNSVKPNGLYPPAVEATLAADFNARFYLWEFLPVLKVEYATARKRSELVTFTLNADVQDLLTEPSSPRFELQTYTGIVNQDVDANPYSDGGSDSNASSMPLGDLRQNNYFNLPRGKQSIDFLILRARARLLSAARASTVSGTIPFAKAIQLSCRKTAIVTDKRLPGGEASGKIVSYDFGLDGSRGELFGSFAIGCAIGRGNSLADPEAGEPSYVEEGYVNQPYQFYDGADRVPVPGEVHYADFTQAVLDDGLNFFRLGPVDIINRLQVFHGKNQQAGVLHQKYLDVQGAVNALNSIFTYFELDLKPVEGGPFDTSYNLVVSDLMVPRMLDLEYEGTS